MANNSYDDRNAPPHHPSSTINSTQIVKGGEASLVSRSRLGSPFLYPSRRLSHIFIQLNTSTIQLHPQSEQAAAPPLPRIIYKADFLGRPSSSKMPYRYSHGTENLCHLSKNSSRVIPYVGSTIPNIATLDFSP